MAGDVKETANGFLVIGGICCEPEEDVAGEITWPLEEAARVIEALPEKQRGYVSTEAAKIITKNRNVSYGEPEDNFQCIAEIWQWWNKWKAEGKFSDAFDVAMMMVLFKLGRIATGQVGTIDNYIDLIGYADIANSLDKK